MARRAGAESFAPHRDSIPGPSNPQQVAIIERKYIAISVKSFYGHPIHCINNFSHYKTLQAFRFQYKRLTYLLTPWCRVLFEKLTGLQLVKKFPAFYATRRFITAFTSVRHLSLSWASPIQSTYPHPTRWRSILILSAHLRLGLPSGLFPSGFPTKPLQYKRLNNQSHPEVTSHDTYFFLLKFITITEGQTPFLNTSRPSVSWHVYSSTKLSVIYVPITGLNRTKEYHKMTRR